MREIAAAGGFEPHSGGQPGGDLGATMSMRDRRERLLRRRRARHTALLCGALCCLGLLPASRPARADDGPSAATRSRRGFVLRVGVGLGATVLRSGGTQRELFAAGLFAKLGGRWGRFGLGWALSTTMIDFEKIGEALDVWAGFFIIAPFISAHTFFGPELTLYFSQTNPTAFVDLGAGVSGFPDVRRNKALAVESGAGFSAAVGYRFGDVAIFARALWSPPFRHEAQAFSGLLMVCASTE